MADYQDEFKRILDEDGRWGCSRKLFRMDTRRPVRSPSTGLRGGSQQHSIIWPIEDTSHINECRKKAGFD